MKCISAHKNYQNQVSILWLILILNQSIYCEFSKIQHGGQLPHSTFSRGIDHTILIFNLACSSILFVHLLLYTYQTYNCAEWGWCCLLYDTGPYPEKISVGVIDFSVGVKAFKLSILSPEYYWFFWKSV